MQITTEKYKLIGYLILGEIKFWILKNEHFEKKSPKSEKDITILHFMAAFNDIVDPVVGIIEIWKP